MRLYLCLGSWDSEMAYGTDYRKKSKKKCKTSKKKYKVKCMKKGDCKPCKECKECQKKQNCVMAKVSGPYAPKSGDYDIWDFLMVCVELVRDIVEIIKDG